MDTRIRSRHSTAGWISAGSTDRSCIVAGATLDAVALVGLERRPCRTHPGCMGSRGHFVRFPARHDVPRRRTDQRTRALLRRLDSALSGRDAARYTRTTRHRLELVAEVPAPVRADRLHVCVLASPHVRVDRRPDRLVDSRRRPHKAVVHHHRNDGVPDDVRAGRHINDGVCSPAGQAMGCVAPPGVRHRRARYDSFLDVREARHS